jgi:hypothetical protein
MTFDRRTFLKLSSLASVAAVVSPRPLRAAIGALDATSASDVLDNGFRHPPHSARPGCYWWWFGGHVDADGITTDLQELSAKGIGELVMVNSRNFGLPDATPDPAPFLSPAWRELNRHALREAKRLGFVVGVNLSGGWCMGGPWITPRLSGRWYLQSKLTVEGPRKFSQRLPLPGGRDGYDKVFNPPGFQEYINLPLEQLDYRDTAVVAIPDHDGGARLTGKRAALLPAKTNRKDASNFTRAAAVMGPTLAPLPNEPGDHPVPAEQVIDLTSRLGVDGTLTWDVPPGRWTIVRTGHRMTGSKLMIPPPTADGLSVDWLASEPVDVQFQQLGSLFIEDAAAAGAKLAYFCDDSFEDGFPNWTEKIVAEFRHYRGYDPVPYLPALGGYIIGSAEISDRFLYDYRRTVADCMADRHYAHFAELCHAQGLEVQNESAGPSRSGTMCMDGLKNLGRSDRPMGEFWLGLRHDQAGGEDPKLEYGVSRLEDGQNKVTKMVSSAAHTYGRRTASAEAFTTNRHWLDYPATLKPAADRAFCEGINRLIIHESTATRAADGLPGYEYYAGTHFNAKQTWWPYVGPFLEYLGSCQFLLQQGHFVADALSYAGDWAPNVAVPKHVEPGLGAGFDYDVCNSEVLLTRLGVKDGRIVLPDGMSYRLLVLPEHDRMPVEVAAKLRELVTAGATLVGPKPIRAPGLANYPRCDEELRAIVAELWGPCDGTTVQQHRVGAGRVFWGVSPREILAQEGIGPDFEHAGSAWIDFIHRTTEEAELYFVVNRNDRPEALDCAFRVKGRIPEIWDPVTGERREPTEWRTNGARCVVPLAFAPYQSFFVLFRRSGSRPPSPKAESPSLSAVRQNFPVATETRPLSGPWSVHFDPQWGAPSEVEFSELVDWTQRSEDGIRHYSGTARYVKSVEVAVPAGRRVFLDLGAVRSIAQVKVNGKDLGVVWTAPWRVEITAAISPGQNLLEIAVANLWHNRLVGDAALPPEQRLSRTNVPIDPKSALVPSGLLGPVALEVMP